MEKPGFSPLVVLAMTLGLAVITGSTWLVLPATGGKSKFGGKTDNWDQSKWRYLFLAILVAIAGAVMIGEFVTWRGVVYWDTIRALVVAVMAVYLGSVCLGLRTKITQSRRDDKATGRDQRKWWSMLLSLLIVIETALIGVLLMLANQIYWGSIQTDVKTILATSALLVSRGMMVAVAVFLLVSVRRTLRTRWLTIEEFITYITGTAIIMTLPLCFREVKYTWGDLINVDYGVSWLSILIAAALALIVFLVYRSTRQEAE